MVMAMAMAMAMVLVSVEGTPKGIAVVAEAKAPVTNGWN